MLINSKNKSKNKRFLDVPANWKVSSLCADSHQMGIFKATSPYDAIHIGYSIKHYNSKKKNYDLDNLKLAFMVSVKTDLALLELMDLNPYHVSRNHIVGEEECALLFPVDYSDNYYEFEDF